MMEKILTEQTVSVEYKLDTKEERPEIITAWFAVTAQGYEWTDIYVGLTKPHGEKVSGSRTFYDLPESMQKKAKEAALALLKKMA